jgi:hypothetical protein
MLVYCVGPAQGGPRCHHNASLNLADLPEWSWPQISAAVGYVDTRLNWSEVIDFTKRVNW